jgi:hypothetical protein
LPRKATGSARAGLGSGAGTGQEVEVAAMVGPGRHAGCRATIALLAAATSRVRTVIGQFYAILVHSVGSP